MRIFLILALMALQLPQIWAQEEEVEEAVELTAEDLLNAQLDVHCFCLNDLYTAAISQELQDLIGNLAYAEGEEEVKAVLADVSAEDAKKWAEDIKTYLKSTKESCSLKEAQAAILEDYPNYWEVLAAEQLQDEKKLAAKLAELKKESYSCSFLEEARAAALLLMKK
ncbi:hypothetical protein [Saprospira grandis]|uniref:hypothetical protein n=1 Tax=Saprospira grandis TaxID=1008 RepID=UPI0022DDE4BA|nr:hypothetical protein [Saprospira grandis]WBM74035.1 hypothetical protein OP864_13690 [Saprospira grandis]